MAHTNPASGKSNLGIEKYMDDAKFEVIKKYWNDGQIGQKDLHDQVSLYFIIFII